MDIASEMVFDAPLGAAIARGRCAEVFALDEQRVLKLFYPGTPEQDVAEELRRTTLASQACALALAPLARVRHEGRDGIVLPRLSPDTLLGQLLQKPWKVAAIGRRLAGLHTEIHACRGDDLPPLRESLAWQIERAELSASQRRQVLDRLAACPDGRALCHMDFHPDQVLLDTRGDVVVDWLTAARGDPRADAARTWLLTSFGQPPGSGLGLRLAITPLRGLLWTAYRRRYEALRGLRLREAVAVWRVPLMAARLTEVDALEERALRKCLDAALR